MNLETFSSIQRWHRQLRKKASAMENGGIPPNTLRMCNSAMREYTQFAGMNPDQLIEDYAKEMRTTGKTTKHNDLLDKFWEAYPTKTTGGVYFALIKGFYKHNDCPLTATTPSIPKVRGKDFKLESQHVRAICDVAPLQHKSWILTNNYICLRIGAITQLKVSDFMIDNWKEDKPLYPVSISKALSGTFDYTTFIGNDAMQTLQTYFRTKEFKPTDKPWDCDESNLNDMLKLYAYKAKVIDAPEGTWADGTPKGFCPLHSHVFRKRGQTVFEKSGIPLNWVDYLLGHVPRGAQAKAYSRPSDEELHNAYLQALPELEIYGHHTQTPTHANVELQKYRAIEEVRKLGLPEDKLNGIINVLKLTKTETEINEALQNVMTVKRK
jgi:integrase